MSILAEPQTRLVPAGHKDRQQVEDEIPFGLFERLENLFTDYVGDSNALKMQQLLALLKNVGFPTTARQVRAANRELRRKGLLLCSGAPGYWLAASRVEADDFIDREIEARAHDLLATGRIMREEAKRQFGEGEQVALFLKEVPGRE